MSWRRFTLKAVSRLTHSTTTKMLCQSKMEWGNIRLRKSICKLIDHNPTKYRFNYTIPIKYDILVTNTTICDLLKDYTDTPDKLIQIPAQSFMQAMGHGPYKRTYLIYGKEIFGRLWKACVQKNACCFREQE
jgi:hypothetical protein